MREKKLKKLCDKYRDKNALYDVIVPGSGGKDSIYVSQLLKNKYKMKVLSVTWAPHLYTDIGWKNFQSWCKTGIDNILVTPNYKVHSKLTSLAFKKLVNPFQPFIMGQKVCAPKIALKYGVKLIFYGENNSEARGNYKENLSPIMDPKHFTRKNKKSKLFFGGVSMDDLKKNME